MNYSHCILVMLDAVLLDWNYWKSIRRFCLSFSIGTKSSKMFSSLKLSVGKDGEKVDNKL